jgi:hypothetical protein
MSDITLTSWEICDKQTSLIVVAQDHCLTWLTMLVCGYPGQGLWLEPVILVICVLSFATQGQIPTCPYGSGLVLGLLSQWAYLLPILFLFRTIYYYQVAVWFIGPYFRRHVTLIVNTTSQYKSTPRRTVNSFVTS